VTVTLESGVVLAGKYRIERVLGQGGMGVVAAAHHIQLDQRIALKLMLPHAMSNPEAVARFVREARAAARISSEHVARVFDVGALPTGEPYIAMEYLEGSDIAQLLASRGHLPHTEAVEYLLQACEALAEAHASGIIHRDLKPGNLFLVARRDGQRLIKVLDFGISKMASGTQSAPMTQTSALMGSPLYMSPEQMGSSKAVDARSDIWALGVVLYEMLAGEPPFNGETLPQVCAMVITEPPPPLEQRAAGLPLALYEVVRRCLEKAPAARYQSVTELARALEPIATVRGRHSVERISRLQGVAALSPDSLSVPAVTERPAAQPGTYAPWGETKPPTPARRSSLPLFAGLGAAAVAAGGVLWFVQRGHLAANAADSSAAPTVAAAPSLPAALVADAPVASAPAQSAAAPASGAVSASPPPPATVPARRGAAIGAKSVSGRNESIAAAPAAPAPEKTPAAAAPEKTRAPAPTPTPSAPVSTRSRL
jgi:eukaryotic-like serine/threonine-protein kinase